MYCQLFNNQPLITTDLNYKSSKINTCRFVVRICHGSVGWPIINHLIIHVTLRRTLRRAVKYFCIDEGKMWICIFFRKRWQWHWASTIRRVNLCFCWIQPTSQKCNCKIYSWNNLLCISENWTQTWKNWD